MMRTTFYRQTGNSTKFLAHDKTNG